MRKNVALVLARVGLAALASAGVLATPAAPASAAPAVSIAALTPAQCDALQSDIDTIDLRVQILQERLSTAPAYQKAGIIKQILKLEAQEAVLQTQYDANC